MNLKLIRRAILPVVVALVIAALHFGWLALFPERAPEQDRWVTVPRASSPLRVYVESQSYWLGYSYALSLAFASVALRRYREDRFCAARNVAIGGVTFSGFLAVAGCYLLGCCGSPMLAVYASLLGTAFLPFAKRFVAALSTVFVAAAWWWMSRGSKAAERRGDGTSCADAARDMSLASSGQRMGVGTATSSEGPARRGESLRRAVRLEYFTVGWNLVEGVIAVTAAVAAGSVVLLGFGVDSFVESASAAVLIWRLRAEREGMDREQIERLDRRAHRLVALSLLLLAAYVAIDAGWGLWTAERPGRSIVGVVLTSVSLAAMWWLARVKRRVARSLGSRALEADAFQTTACWWLSLITLSGVGLNALLGWWWADPVAALGMTYFLVKEGAEAWRGEECCG